MKRLDSKHRQNEFQDEHLPEYVRFLCIDSTDAAYMDVYVYLRTYV